MRMAIARPVYVAENLFVKGKPGKNDQFSPHLYKMPQSHQLARD